MDDTIRAEADRLAGLIEQHLGVRGRGFETKLRRAGRLLPRHLRRAGYEIVQAMQLEGHPKLRRRIDRAGVTRATRALEAHLAAIDPWRRRIDRTLDILAAIAFALVVTAGLTIAVLRWRGFL